ncbi:hypothetical protein IWW50_005912, partial [Coemansia erecta]
FLKMNLAMYATPNASVSASAPVTPGLGLRQPLQQADSGALSATNPFFASQASRPGSLAGSFAGSPGHEEGPSARTVVDLPFMAHSRSNSSIVAETGCLRSLRSPAAAAASSRDRSLSQAKAANDSRSISHAKLANDSRDRSLSQASESPLANIKGAHALLQRSLREMPKDINDELCQDLQAIVEMAQSLLAKAQKV